MLVYLYYGQRVSIFQRRFSCDLVVGHGKYLFSSCLVVIYLLFLYEHKII